MYLLRFVRHRQGWQELSYAVENAGRMNRLNLRTLVQSSRPRDQDLICGKTVRLQRQMTIPIGCASSRNCRYNVDEKWHFAKHPKETMLVRRNGFLLPLLSAFKAIRHAMLSKTPKMRDPTDRTFRHTQDDED